MTIILWTGFLSYLIYRNTPKPLITELANAVGIEASHKSKKSMESLKAVTLAPFNWVAAKLFGEEIPRILIDIKFKHFEKLQQAREKALAEGYLVQGPDDYVPGKIRIGDRTVKVKLRLKGDLIDHLKTDKWSFRIHVKGDDHFFGMRRFSIQKPGARNFEAEILFFEALRREGVLTPRYFFIEAVVNGKDIGLMAVEEHFSKELLESQGRREGVILKFNESQFHEELHGAQGLFPYVASYKNVDIQPFREGKIARSAALTSDLKTARGLLRAFLSRALSASEVFDVELMGRFLAVGDLWGAWHALKWHNVRYYYNPITTRLEPIGYDAILKEKRIDFPVYHKLSADLLSDPTILRVYRKTLARLAEEMADGAMLEWARPVQEKQLGILHREFPFLDGVDLERLAQRGQSRKNKLHNYAKKYDVILKAYHVIDGQKSYLELINPLPEPVVISSLQLFDQGAQTKLPFPANPAMEFPFRLEPTSLEETPKPNIFPFRALRENDNFSVWIAANVLNQEDSRTIVSIPYHAPREKPPVPKTTVGDALRKHAFLSLAAGGNEIRMQPGAWRVAEWLIVPEGVSLRIAEGTELRFDASAGLIAHGPVNIEGTEADPVVFRGAGDSEDEKRWPGIMIMKTQETSKWAYVRIQDTKGIGLDGWNPSGGVNFYEADIQMNHVRLTGNRSEDALNIVRSEFELHNVVIQDAASDAFDADFSKGTVTGGRYENIGGSGGGDGIDVSGSEVTVTGVAFKNIADKALSVGEKSVMRAEKVTMEDIGIGAASKDGSRLNLSDAKITGAKTAALMAYVKKPEYGPATIDAAGLETRNVPSIAMAQKGSRITIDGEAIETTDLNVKELYAASTNK